MKREKLATLAPEDWIHFLYDSRGELTDHAWELFSEWYGKDFKKDQAWDFRKQVVISKLCKEVARENQI